MELTRSRSAVFISIVFLVLVLNPAIGSTPGLGNVADVISFGEEINSVIFRTWELVANDERLNDHGPDHHLFVKWNEELVMKNLSSVSDKIDAFEKSRNIRSSISFANIITELQQQNQLSNHLRELNNRIRRVSRLYGVFYQYSKSPEIYEEATLAGSAWENVSPSNGIPESLEFIHSLIKPDEHGFANVNLFELLIDNLKLQNGYTAICQTKQSPQQSLYNLYNNIAVTEIKGYALTQFSWLWLKICNQGNFTEEIGQAKERHETRMAESLEAVRTAMMSANRDLWKCDSPYPRGKLASTELTNLVQGLIVNEVDLNNDGSCTKTCDHYQYSSTYGCYDADHCPTLKRCNGRVYNCQFIDSDMSVCPARADSGRRYMYVRYENNQEFGKRQSCALGSSTIESWTRWFVHCSYCLCFCDDDAGSTERFFNLREVVTDLKKNKVMTGVKFVKNNRVIHLQIEQGELLEKGMIGNGTEWKPVDAYSPHDYSVREGSDYLKLSWNYRYMDLDELTAPPGYLVTGVRFRTLGYHLNLEIRITPFNFSTGVLAKNLTESQWHGNDNTDTSWKNPRKSITLSEPDRSTNTELPSIPDFESNKFVKFVPTDLKKDAAQSTVPFIDTQPVVPYPRIPIAGAGIYHKGRPGFGGYVAPKLRTYDFTPHLHIPELTPRPNPELFDNRIGRQTFL